MSSTSRMSPRTEVVIDRMLESAVVLSWNDLLKPSQKDLINIEHSSGTTLPYLKIWQLTGKGEWSLVCEYWMASASFGAMHKGITFSNGYRSEGLSGMLEVIMQHQGSFLPSAWKQGTSVTQVTAPTEQENLAAGEYMQRAYESFGLAHIPAPAMA